MYCRRCGIRLVSDAKKCPECGLDTYGNEYNGGFWGLLTETDRENSPEVVRSDIHRESEEASKDSLKTRKYTAQRKETYFEDDDEDQFFQEQMPTSPVKGTERASERKTSLLPLILLGAGAALFLAAGIILMFQLSDYAQRYRQLEVQYQDLSQNYEELRQKYLPAEQVDGGHFNEAFTFGQTSENIRTEIPDTIQEGNRADLEERKSE